MEISPTTRQANVWLFVGLVAFSILLAVAVIWWMRVSTRAKGGIVDPQKPQAVWHWQPAPRDGAFARLAA